MLNIKQPAMTTGAREADMAKRRIFRAILPDGTEIKRTSTSRAYAWAVTGKWPDGRWYGASWRRERKDAESEAARLRGRLVGLTDVVIVPAVESVDPLTPTGEK